MTSKDYMRRITVGELRKELSAYHDDTEITFGCTDNAVPLVYERVKNRSPIGKDTLIQIELRELHDD